MLAVVCMALRNHVPPSAVLSWSESDFYYCLAALKMEHDDHQRRNRN